LGDALSEKAEMEYVMREYKREKWEMDSNPAGEVRRRPTRARAPPNFDAHPKAPLKAPLICSPPGRSPAPVTPSRQPGAFALAPWCLFPTCAHHQISEMVELYEAKGIPTDDALVILHTMAKYKDFFVDHMMVTLIS
jgi:hypothetical protein